MPITASSKTATRPPTVPATRDTGFWQQLAADRSLSFDLEDVIVTGERATILWRLWFDEGEQSSVRGVNLMQVRDGKIVEALGYVKAG